MRIQIAQITQVTISSFVVLEEVDIELGKMIAVTASIKPYPT
ncbi:hypothetical protein [Wujia sp.]